MSEISSLRQIQRRLSEEYLVFFSKLRLSLLDVGRTADAFKAEDAYLKTQRAIRLIGRVLGAGDTPISDKEVKELSAVVQYLHSTRDYFIHKSKTQQRIRQAISPLISSGAFSLQNIILPPISTEQASVVTKTSAPVKTDPLLSSRFSISGAWGMTESLLLNLKRNLVDSGLLSPLIGPFAGPLSMLLTIPSMVSSTFHKAKSFFARPTMSNFTKTFPVPPLPAEITSAMDSSGYIPTTSDNQDSFKKSLFEFFDKEAFKARWTRLIFTALSKSDKKFLEEMKAEGLVESGGIGKGIGIGLGAGILPSFLKGLAGAALGVGAIAALSSDTVLDSIKRFAADPKKALANLYDTLVSVYEKLPEGVKDLFREYTPQFIKNMFLQFEDFLKSDKPLLVSLDETAQKLTKRLGEVILSLSFGFLKEISEYVSYKTREYFPQISSFFSSFSSSLQPLITNPGQTIKDITSLSGLMGSGFVDIQKDLSKRTSLEEMLTPLEVFYDSIGKGDYKSAFNRLGGLTPKEYVEAASARLVSLNKQKEAEALQSYAKSNEDLFYINYGQHLEKILEQFEYVAKRSQAVDEKGQIDVEKLNATLDQLTRILSTYRTNTNTTPQSNVNDQPPPIVGGTGLFGFTPLISNQPGPGGFGW